MPITAYRLAPTGRESYQEFLEKESEIQETSSKAKKKIIKKIENIKSDIIKVTPLTYPYSKLN